MIPAIFDDCCDKESTRYNLATPWVAGGYLYATDGRVACRMPIALLTPEEIEAHPENLPDGGRRPRVGDLFEPHYERQPQPTPIPADLPPEMAPCKWCDGKDSKHVECDNCDGTGDCDCDCGHCHDCGYCDGTGKVVCDGCDGEGSAPNEEVVAVGEAHFKACMLSMFARHGATELFLGKRPGQDAARAVIGDVEALIMPCQVQEPAEVTR